MQIDLDLLFTWGAIFKAYCKNETIFEEGDKANFYFQVVEGDVRMFNSSEEGKEFTQGYFYKGQSFGEPPLLINEQYPASAVAHHSCKIIKLSKDKFLRMLQEYPNIQKNLLELMARRIHSKATASKDIINHKPETRILSFLKANKKGSCDQKELVPFTRQEIANFTGLRVETVIRTISKLQEANKVAIINHKVYY